MHLINQSNNKAKKEYGQHFLKNKHIIRKIISSIPSSYSHIIEIGPGKGALTKELLKHFNVQAIEIDNDCVLRLYNAFADNISNIAEKNLTIIHQNVLEYKFSSSTYSSCVVGNLPYNISTKMIQKVLNEGVACAVFMLQKEVAMRILEADSPLGICVHARYLVSKVVKAEAKDFSPQPKVESQVIKLVKHDMFNEVDLEKLNDLTKTMFANRRKKISHLKKNNPQLIQLLIDNNIDINLRAEQIPKEKYYLLSKIK